MELNRYRMLINGKEIFQGTKAEICQEFGVAHNTFYHAAKYGRRLMNTYDIELLPQKEIVVGGRRKTEKQSKLEFLSEHLRIYSNVASDFDPVPYFPDLYDLGFNCKCREVVIKERSRVSGRHRKNDVFYVTECV